MGINSIKCDGMYAEVGKTGFGEGTRGASDFDGTDLLKGAALLALLAAGTFVAGCISSPEKKDAPISLGYKDQSDCGVDTELDAKQLGDIAKFHSDITDVDYKAIFRGVMPDNGTLKAHFDIIRKDPATGSIESQHVALPDYIKPDTRDEAMAQYQGLLNGSTAQVASLNFKGNEHFPGLKVLAYADLKNEKEVVFRMAEGYLDLTLEAPEGSGAIVVPVVPPMIMR